MFQSPIYWSVLFASVIVFWLLPRAVRFGFLGLVSFGYLYWIEVHHGPSLISFNSTVVLLIWTCVFYWLAPIVMRKGTPGKVTLALLIFAIVGYLAYYKYIPRLAADMFGPDSTMAAIALPLGISYFTFKLIHYVAEIGRGTITDHSFQRFFSFIFLFPIFTAGPIERYDHYLASPADRLRRDDVVIGLSRIIYGLVKKFVFAELILLPLIGGVPNVHELVEFLPLVPWYKVVAFLVGRFLYAYLDFSSYSDIAIGSSRLYGIRIMENFNWPILAPNIATFWQRWHMTLAGWCKSYVYLPTMGLTRNPWIAVYATFVVMGLWHAGSINWIGWGLYNATGLCAYLLFLRLRRTKKIKLPEFGPLRYWGVPLTFAYMSGMGAFTATDGLGVYAAIRILAKCAFIDLPPLH